LDVVHSLGLATDAPWTPDRRFGCASVSACQNFANDFLQAPLHAGTGDNKCLDFALRCSFLLSNQIIFSSCCETSMLSGRFSNLFRERTAGDG